MEQLSNLQTGHIYLVNKQYTFDLTIQLALSIGVPPRRINEIVHRKRSISADTALRLGRYFKISPQFWINLQSHYDLEIEMDKLGDRLEHEVKACSVVSE